METPEKYFKKWSENCRFFTNYSAIHSHEDMMEFAEDYFEHKLKKDYIKINDILYKVK
jgi:hypothetical protein